MCHRVQCSNIEKMEVPSPNQLQVIYPLWAECPMLTRMVVAGQFMMTTVPPAERTKQMHEHDQCMCLAKDIL